MRLIARTFSSLLAWREPHHGLPLPKRVAAKVRTKSRLSPGVARICRQQNICNPIAAIEGDALYERLDSGLDLGTVGEVRDERAHVEALDGNGCGGCLARFRAGAAIVGDAISGLHPKAVVDTVDHGDLVEVLYPVGAVVARHDEPHGIAVEPRQVFSVHALRNHDLAISGVFDVESFDEVRRFWEDGLVKTVKSDLTAPGLNTGLVENGL
jgi:hypothetical protein